MKIALVCDFLTKMGGAQKVLLALSEIYPDAPIYCQLYDEKGTGGFFKNKQIIESELARMPAFIKSRPKLSISKLSQSIENFDFSQYDIVISSSDSFAHGIITKPKTFHLCYCHTPMRYAWDWHSEYLAENNLGFGLKGMYVRYLLYNIRIWDKAAADRVDHWVANSENVKKRIRKYYRSDANVVYPPVDIDKIKIADQPPQDYYVIAARLEPYKKINLAIQACNKLKKKLLIIGDGSQLKYLKKIAGPTIQFVGWKTGDDLYKYLREAKAFIFPGEDDFGIAPVESMAAGRPVIAYKKGGVLESIVEGETGVFFEDESVESLENAILELEKNYHHFKPIVCRKQAEKFSKTHFIRKIKERITEGYRQYRERMGYE